MFRVLSTIPTDQTEDQILQAQIREKKKAAAQAGQIHQVAENAKKSAKVQKFRGFYGHLLYTAIGDQNELKKAGNPSCKDGPFCSEHPLLLLLKKLHGIGGWFEICKCSHFIDPKTALGGVMNLDPSVIPPKWGIQPLGLGLGEKFDLLKCFKEGRLFDFVPQVHKPSVKCFAQCHVCDSKFPDRESFTEHLNQSGHRRGRGVGAKPASQASIEPPVRASIEPSVQASIEPPVQASAKPLVQATKPKPSKPAIVPSPEELEAISAKKALQAANKKAKAANKKAEAQSQAAKAKNAQKAADKAAKKAAHDAEVAKAAHDAEIAKAAHDAEVAKAAHDAEIAKAAEVRPPLVTLRCDPSLFIPTDKFEPELTEEEKKIEARRQRADKERAEAVARKSSSVAQTLTKGGIDLSEIWH